MTRGCCPFHGDSCPGPDECAPAIYLAESSKSEQIPDIGQPVAPECPIVTSIKSSMITAGALLPLLLGRPDEPKEEISDESLRVRVLENLHLDEG